MQITVLGSQGDEVGGYSNWLKEAYKNHQVNVIDAGQQNQLRAGDIALIVNSVRELSEPECQLLQCLGRRGIKRILWHLEPLPPANLTGLSERLMNLGFALDHRNESELPTVTRLLNKAIDGCILRSMAVCLTLSSDGDVSHVPTAKMLGFPLRQARSLLAFWRQGLIDQVYVSLPSRVPFLKKYGIPSKLLPAAYGPWYGALDPHAIRDIDVLFLGRVPPRRRKLLNRIASELRAHGFSLKIVDRNCYGEQRTALLNRTKILLNILNFTWEFPLMRLFMAMSCGALVVSEVAAETPALFDDRHLVVRPIDEIVESLVANLVNETARRDMTEAAHYHVTTELTLDKLLPAALADPNITSSGTHVDV